MISTHMKAAALRGFKAGCLAVAVFLAFGSDAHAQYASGFSYYDPQSGFYYSQGARYGRGYYSGGFTFAPPYYGYSTNYGYGRRWNRWSRSYGGGYRNYGRGGAASRYWRYR